MHCMNECVLLMLCLAECKGQGVYWSCNTVQLKGETSAQQLVPCYARVGHIMLMMVYYGIYNNEVHFSDRSMVSPLPFW